MLKGLYAITDTALTPYTENKILFLVEEALKGGATIIQLRDKNTPDDELITIGTSLKELCHRYNALFIVNDRPTLAKKLKADGVHLGKDDVNLEHIRDIYPEGIIGISCYGDIERARLAEAKGADYVAFGSFFPSPTKPQSEIVPKKVILEAKAVLKIPVCAIGGITINNAKELVDLGADMLAVISDLWTADDIQKRAQDYSRLYGIKR